MLVSREWLGIVGKRICITLPRSGRGGLAGPERVFSRRNMFRLVEDPHRTMAPVSPGGRVMSDDLGYSVLSVICRRPIDWLRQRLGHADCVGWFRFIG